jgi:protein-S-isoprenylcysteine O-methyltransferase Ste14
VYHLRPVPSNLMPMLETITFIAGTLGLAYLSRGSLRIPGSHGFHRFIAWEGMLLLVVHNLDGWYSAPLGWDQIVCGILMALSLLLALLGFLSLQQFGQLDGRRDDESLFTFERTTVLVTHGVFRLIRHPMYSSLILLDWGLFFKKMSWLSGSVAFIAFIFLILATLAEEHENLAYFGTRYRDYMRDSKRFIPWLL